MDCEGAKKEKRKRGSAAAAAAEEVAISFVSQVKCSFLDLNVSQSKGRGDYTELAYVWIYELGSGRIRDIAIWKYVL